MMLEYIINAPALDFTLISNSAGEKGVALSAKAALFNCSTVTGTWFSEITDPAIWGVLKSFPFLSIFLIYYFQTDIII